MFAELPIRNQLKQEIRTKVDDFKTLKFKDHHAFNSTDIKQIVGQFSKMNSENKIIITTEKDATRLSQFETELKDFPVFVLPMAHQFLFDGQKEFDKIIFEFIDTYKKPDTHQD